MKKVTLRFRSVVVSAIGALGIGCSGGAVTLTIDTYHQTFTWSGTATSDILNLPDGSSADFRLGSNAWLGGSALNEGGGDSITLGGGLPDNFIPSDTPGQMIVAESEGSIYLGLGSISASDQQIQFVLTGDGTEYSYASGTPSGGYESLDGVQLYFQYASMGGFINFGDPAGQVVVIPEPSSGMLLLGAVAGLALRRRRR
ncbi:PEP-CTERM sorting domain-containing protein [Luteolibacter sp. Populi]|uniref:PEP-CTERM sorting domain-containing protein n=1 Tax=Luteolibacter sp. Populi TaxID=3230487 RepID=UPI003466A553